jgi:hypothetical protein
MSQQDLDVLKKRYASYDQDFSSATFTTLDHVYRADPGVFTEGEKKTIKQAYLEQDAAKVAKILGSIGTRERPKPPRLLIPAEEFTLPKAAETFASAAMRSYDISSNPEKYLSKEDAKGIRAAGIMGVAQAPIITIENETDRAFARGDSLRSLVKASRDKFIERLVAEKKVPLEKATEIATNMIGATWDVGHINLMKRYGYNEQQIADEIKAIKKDVKHVHIHDNFGSFDAHLAPGMGNVPIQAILKELQTEGKMPKGVRGIVEAGGYVMNFGENPTLKTLEYFRAPAYGFQGAPSWGGESPMAGGYFMGSSAYSAGYGLMLPPIHYSEYGAGFTGLPPSLAAVPGTAQRSQFAGTPNA